MKRSLTKTVIKVCVNPMCEAVFLGIKKTLTRCIDCNFILIEINRECYEKKFSNNFFQYDHKMELITTKKQTEMILLTP